MALAGPRAGVESAATSGRNGNTFIPAYFPAQIPGHR